MKHEFLHKSPLVILYFAAIFICSLPVFSQQANKTTTPLVILTALASPKGDTVAGTLASTMTSSIELMLKLTGRVTFRRADFLIPTVSLERTIPYYDEHKAAEAVYGSVTTTGNGEYAIELDVWNASKPNSKPTVVKRTISNVLSSFTLADEMSLKVASTIVGRKLEEGTLLVQDVSSLPKFSVYANGHLLGRNRTSFHILTGNWTIIVAEPGEVGDVAVQTFHVDIRQGKTATVALSPAPSRQAVAANNAKAAQSAGSVPSNSSSSSVNEPIPTLTVSPAIGSISINTKTGGTLYLDGQMMGRIPVGGAALSSVGVGVRELSMHYANGQVERKEVTVRAGSSTNATFSYRRVPPGTRWTEHPLPSNQDWGPMTYGNGTFVAIVPYSRVAATSSDGINWTEGTLPSNSDWDSATYGNGTFVVVASNSNVVATSNDGVKWARHNLPSRQYWSSVTYGNGTFVAVATGSNVLATSSDGVNWTEGSLPSSENWFSVTCGNGTFVVVVRNANVVATSSGGVNWTESSLPSNQVWSSVAYGNGTFVAVAFDSSAVAASSDGVNWTEGSLPSSQEWQSVTYGKGTFVAIASNSNALATSTDGVSWTEGSLPSSRDWPSVTYGNGTFVAVASYSNVVATSP